MTDKQAHHTPGPLTRSNLNSMVGMAWLNDPKPPQLDDAPDDIAKAVQVRRVPQVGLVPVDGPHRVRIDDRLNEWFKNECGTCEIDEGGIVHAQGFTIETDDEGVWLVANDVMIED